MSIGFCSGQKLIIVVRCTPQGNNFGSEVNTRACGPPCCFGLNYPPSTIIIVALVSGLVVDNLPERSIPLVGGSEWSLGQGHNQQRVLSGKETRPFAYLNPPHSLPRHVPRHEDNTDNPNITQSQAVTVAII